MWQKELFILLAWPMRHPIYAFVFFMIIWKYSDMKQIICIREKEMGSDGKPVFTFSSRRTIAIMSAWALVHISTYWMKYPEKVNPYLAWPLMLLCILCLGLTTWEQIMSGINTLKGLMVTHTSTTKETKTEIQGPQ